MGGEVEAIGIAEARSAMVWWLDAGVDAPVQEQPRNWLRPPAPRNPAPAEAPPEPNVTPPSHETLAELQAWLATSAHLPLASLAAKRIMPQGCQNAELMLLADAPALEDYVAGRPIGGEAWELAQRMLAAIGLTPEQAYCASLSPIHAPGATLTGRDHEDHAEIARRHVRLAGPRRLLLLGDGPSKTLLGKPVAKARGHVHKVEGVRTVATFHPRSLINQPSSKSLAWKDLLLLMEEES